MPKQPAPGVGYSAFFKDTEGNVVGIMHSDTTAKKIMALVRDLQARCAAKGVVWTAELKGVKK